MTLTLNKIKIIHLAIFLSLFFAFFLGFNNGNVSADSQDITYTVDSNSTVPFYFCDDSLTNSQVKCSDYSHIIFSPSYVNEFYFTIAVNNSTIRIPNFTDTTFDLSGINTVFIATLNNQSFSSVTVTLSNSSTGGIVPEGSTTITENGTYDVSQYASVNVNVPVNVTEIIEDPISNDFQKVFFEIVKNIIPAFGILLVVWFGIDMLSSLIFGRGR